MTKNSSLSCRQFICDCNFNGFLVYLATYAMFSMKWNAHEIKFLLRNHPTKRRSSLLFLFFFNSINSKSLMFLFCIFVHSFSIRYTFKTPHGFSLIFFFIVDCGSHRAFPFRLPISFFLFPFCARIQHWIKNHVNLSSWIAFI